MERRWLRNSARNSGRKNWSRPDFRYRRTKSGHRSSEIAMEAHLSQRSFAKTDELLLTTTYARRNSGRPTGWWEISFDSRHSSRTQVSRFMVKVSIKIGSYESEVKIYGRHKLLAIAVNRVDLSWNKGRHSETPVVTRVKFFNILQFLYINTRLDLTCHYPRNQLISQQQTTLLLKSTDHENKIKRSKHYQYDVGNCCPVHVCINCMCCFRQPKQ